jgi:hypothetical protein
VNESHQPHRAEGDGPAPDSLEAGLAAGFAGPPDATRSFRPISEAVGAVIAGKYKLLKQIGDR